MGLCRNCRHYQAGAGGTYTSKSQTVKMGKCKRISMEMYSYVESDETYMTVDYKTKQPTEKKMLFPMSFSLAYVEDGSSYYAALITAPEFGCVLFEQEEK